MRHYNVLDIRHGADDDDVFVKAGIAESLYIHLECLIQLTDLMASQLTKDYKYDTIESAKEAIKLADEDM